MEKKRYRSRLLFLLLIGLCAAGANAQEAKYPPLSEYMMARDAEIALAKSAAPDYVSDHATIKVERSRIEPGKSMICVRSFHGLGFELPCGFNPV